MTSTLAGKSILVTRPAGQAQTLVDQLTALGATAIALPVIEIQPIAIELADRQKIIDLDRYDIVIVVSPNAAQLGMSAIDQYWPQLPAHIQWYAVGEATSQILATAGIRVTVPTSGANSEALLALFELQSVNGKRVLILKGEGGREVLAQTLSDRSASVENLSLYRRDQISYSSEQLKAKIGSQLPDAAVVTSVDILNGMHAALSPCYPNLMGVNLVVASERIDQKAVTLGYHSVFTASGASNLAIIDALNNIV